MANKIDMLGDAYSNETKKIEVEMLKYHMERRVVCLPFLLELCVIHSSLQFAPLRRSINGTSLISKQTFH
jgi:hypothetical protein